MLNDKTLNLEENKEVVYYFPYIDFNNCRIKDLTDVKNFENDQIDRFCQPRLPWHDVHTKIVGKPAKDLATHFIQYWNFASVDVGIIFYKYQEIFIIKKKKFN